MINAGSPKKEAAVRWKKGATEGLVGCFLVFATISTTDGGAGFFGRGTNRSRRDSRDCRSRLARCPVDDGDDGIRSALLGLVGLGDGRSEAGWSTAFRFRDLVVRSLLIQGCSEPEASMERRMIKNG